jgi:hypothetical protein
MINLTDSLSACTASGILAYAKQIYQQMSGGTATNVEDLLNEHEAEIQSAIKLNEYDEVNITHPFSKELAGSILCNLTKDNEKIIQEYPGSDLPADAVRNGHFYIATNMGNHGVGILGDDFTGYDLGEEITNVNDSSDKSIILDCFKLNDYWVLETESELALSYSSVYSSIGNYYQTRDITPFRLEQDGSLYLMNVGGYNGDASTTHQSESLQYVLNQIVSGSVTSWDDLADKPTILDEYDVRDIVLERSLLHYDEDGNYVSYTPNGNTSNSLDGVFDSILLGRANTSNDTYNGIILGRLNTTDGNYDSESNDSTVIVGKSNTNSSRNSVLIGDSNNNNQNKSVMLGSSNINKSEGGVNIGYYNQNNGGERNVMIGYDNTSSNSASTLCMGSKNRLTWYNNNSANQEIIAIGRGLECNTGGIFLGYYNVDDNILTGDTANFLTIGNGSGTTYSSTRSNIIEQRRNGDIFIKGIGNYNGNNSRRNVQDPTRGKSLQEVISGISALTESKLAQTPNNSLELGRTNFVNNTSDSIAGGVGVNAKGDRAFGFGQAYMAVYLTGSGESDNNSEYPYTMMIGDATGYTTHDVVAEEFAKTMVGAYLLDTTNNFHRYAIINSITYNGQNQPLSVNLDCSLGQKTNAVWAVENIGSGRTFSVGGGYGNIGQYGLAMGNYAFNSAKNGVAIGQCNANGGQNSTLLGQYNHNKSTFTSITGSFNYNTGQNATIVGYQNSNSVDGGCVMLGVKQVISGTTTPSVVVGWNNVVDGNSQGFAFGKNITFTNNSAGCLIGENNQISKGQNCPTNYARGYGFGDHLLLSRNGFAFGMYNKDYDVSDVNKQNYFVIGGGNSNQRANSFELKPNGDLYIYGVGGFNGSNSDTSTPKTLQAKIAELENAKALLNELNTKMNVLMDDMDVEAKFAYGVQWDKTATSPDCTRVGNMLLHAMLPVQSQMRGCLLNDNGEVVKYLAESGWTEETLDGSMGQVMVEIPEFYWKFTESGNTQTVMLSQVPIEGYTKVPKRYVSAYEATIDNNGNTGTTNSSQYKLASVKNTTARYRGCNNVASNDETYKSGLGMPRTNLSLQIYRESARRRKPSTYEWNCYDYMTHKILYWLFVVEFATRHTQKAFDNTTTISGYKTGGLGNGVTTVNYTEWTNLYGNYPIVPCGTSDSLGNGTGEVSYAVPSSGAGDTWTTVKVPRYRGIENPFGHIWKQTDGIKVEVEPGGTTSGESKVYVCYTPSNYNSTSDVANYNYIGNEERSQGNVKEIFFGPSGDLFTSVNGGGSNTYYGDYHYVKTDNTAIEYRSVRFGGSANCGAAAGFVCTSSNNGLSTTNSIYGSRLCFIPDAT